MALVIVLTIPLQALALSKEWRASIDYRSELYLPGDDCDIGGLNGPIARGSDNQQTAFNFFIRQGLAPGQSAGIVGNLIAESGVDPKLQEYNKPHGDLNEPLNGTGYGIAQWTFTSRQSKLVAYANEHDLDVSSLDAQLGYYWKELTTDYRGVFEELKSTQTSADASYVILAKFEVPADIEGQKPIRAHQAATVLERYGSSAPDQGDGGNLPISASGGCATATGITATYQTGDIAFPIDAPVVDEANWTQDQGVDIATAGSKCGSSAHLVAMGEGDIVKVGIDGFGQWAPVLHITKGVLKDRYIYYGHAKPNHVEVGDHVKTGQTIADVGCGIVGISTGPHLEIGIWPESKNPDNSFPKMMETSAEMLKILKEAYAKQQSDRTNI